MAITTSLLEPNSLKWKHQLSFPRLLPHRAVNFNNNNIVTLQRSDNGVRTVKSILTSKKSRVLTNPSPNSVSNGSLFDPLRISVETVTTTISKALKALTKPATVAVLLGLLLMYDPNSAFAASGGRMGGRSFSSSRHSSSSSSRSYSVVQPRVSYSAPYYAPSPFGGGGFYVGPAVGVGVGAGSSLFLILAGFAAFVLVSGFLSDRDDGGVLTATEKTSVIKVQV